MERYVVIDLETTGHSPVKDDKIIEAGIVVIENNRIVDTHASLFNPNKKISPFISNLTGIIDEDVEEAPVFGEKADQIIELFHSSYLIAHNVDFDFGFLNAELEKNGRKKLKNPVLDTVELARIIYPKAPSYKLSQLANYLQIEHDDPHRALSDAYVTALVFLKLKKKLESLPYETVSRLLQLENVLKSDLYDLLADREKNLAFSPAEKDGLVSFGGLSFRMINETKSNPCTLEESFGDYLDHIYERGGTMEKTILNYEKRNGQREMSETIFDAFAANKHALIEAETGTGKSLSYLIPAIYYAVKDNKRLVISTYTTQLQAQLLENEIPSIHKLVDIPFQASILKGKSHYLSLEKFANELNADYQDNYDITLTKAMLLVWITETNTGDIDEVQLPSSGYAYFNKISAMTEKVDPTSPWFYHSYYQHAKRRARQADIIITNHALLCTDMFNDYQFLPGYDKVIIDEAHHLEEAVSHHFGLKMDDSRIQFMLNQIGRTEEEKTMGTLFSHVNNQEIPLEEWDAKFDQVKYESDELFHMIFQYVLKQQQNNKSLSDIGRVQYLFDEAEEKSAKWDAIIEMASRLTFYLRDLIHILSVIKQYAEQKELLDKYDAEEINRIFTSLQSFIDQLEQLFLVQNADQQVKWAEIETHSTRNAVYLYSESKDVSELLQNNFFNKKESVILTSATLTMRNSFSFMQNQLGIPSDRLMTEQIASPFSYEDQVQVLIPNDFPDVKRGNMDDFIYATCEAILSLAEITEGRMLILFTSYDMLRRSYALLKEIMNTDEYKIIGQGISSGSRSRLKKNFQSADKAILLGTSSFWEGVDIPGEDLSCLMIVRLPFQPPNHPIYKAKSDDLKKNGKNAFMELSLPNAVIRFKQGFGRLIRSKQDRGIVFICDARIKQARYGKFFTESIPSVPITYDSTQKLITKAQEWF